MNKIGKIGRINQEARNSIAEQCEEMGLQTCEIQFPGCMRTFGVAPAHKHKREWYRGKPELLSDRSEWRVACQYCHSILDDRSKTSQTESDSFFEDSYARTTPISRQALRQTQSLPLEAFDIEGTEGAEEENASHNQKT